MLPEPERHFTLADGLDKALLDGMLAKQFQRPTDTAVGRFTTGQGNHLLLLPWGKRRWGTTSRRVKQPAIQTSCTEPLANAANGPLRAANVLDNLLIGEAFVGFKQNQRPSHHTHRTCAGLHQLLQLLSGLIREAYNMFLHAGTYSTGNHFMEDVLASYVFTDDAERAQQVIARLAFGHVGLNTGNGPAAHAPFGGMKQSGFGREGGLEGLLEYCETQTIASASKAQLRANPNRFGSVP